MLIFLLIVGLFCSQISANVNLYWAKDWNINELRANFVDKLSPEETNALVVLSSPIQHDLISLDRDSSTYDELFIELGRGDDWQYEGEADGLHWYTAMMMIPNREGLFTLVWDVDNEKISKVLEISCSDDIFCNGAERYVDGQCVANTNLPCVFGDDECETHECLEDIKSCSRKPRRLMESGEGWEDVPNCAKCGSELNIGVVSNIADSSTCDSLAPVCPIEEREHENQWCGSDCKWYDVGVELMDLIPPIEEEITDSLMFKSELYHLSDCAVEEGCVRVPENVDENDLFERKLMKFDTNVHNIGGGFAIPGPGIRQDLYMYSPCHEHYHFEDFSIFQLNELGGDSLFLGHKQAFCLRDSAQWLKGPHIQCDAYYECSMEQQGISAGWTDIYHAGLDCQWIDITELALEGEGKWFELEICLNHVRKLQEKSFDNNCRKMPVWVPADIDENVKHYRNIVGAEECAMLPEGWDVPKVCEPYVVNGLVSESMIVETYKKGGY